MPYFGTGHMKNYIWTKIQLIFFKNGCECFFQQSRAPYICNQPSTFEGSSSIPSLKSTHDKVFFQKSYFSPKKWSNLKNSFKFNNPPIGPLFWHNPHRLQCSSSIPSFTSHMTKFFFLKKLFFPQKMTQSEKFLQGE